MSNFMHKVKDAMTDHEKPVTRSQVSDNRTHSATNPFSSEYNEGQSAPEINQNDARDYASNRLDQKNYNEVSGPDPNANNLDYEKQPDSTATDANASNWRPDNRDKSFAPGNITSGAKSANVNSGPHQSALANKLDPRVDSGSDTSNSNAHQESASPQTGNVGNIGAMDQHTSSEENFSRSTHERRSQQQPMQHSSATGQAGLEEFESSTDEQKSHKSTSHISPCTSTTTKNEPIFENTQPQFGGNAAGGSSYNEPANTRGSHDVSHNTLPQKHTAGAGANRAVEQQDIPSDQRVRY
ncbi:hypothetical protein N7488_002376 [Penicillium malachiteum]|nr:hypothetical protein N7488_002376 [Penicillium malachiteum]